MVHWWVDLWSVLYNGSGRGNEQRGVMRLVTDSGLMIVILTFPFDYRYPHSRQFIELHAPPLRSYVSIGGDDSLAASQRKQFAFRRKSTTNLTRRRVGGKQP